MSEAINETIELDDEIAETPEIPEPSYHSVAEVWLRVLEANESVREGGVNMTAAASLTQSYPHLTFQDCYPVHERFHTIMSGMLDILEGVLAGRAHAFSVDNPVDDLELNRQLYIDLLREWQKELVSLELMWSPVFPDAAIQFAAFHLAYKFFFDPSTGLVNHLESIKLTLTEDERNELAEALQAHKEANGE